MFGRIVCVFLTTCVCVSEGLLVEADRLAQERLCVQRQAEKDRSSLSLRLRALETELEDQENQGLTAEQQHRAQSEDLLQRVQALEKQLKHDRQFIDVSVTLWGNVWMCKTHTCPHKFISRSRQWSGSMREMISNKRSEVWRLSSDSQQDTLLGPARASG